MINLKELELINFCGYKSFKINLSDGKDINKWVALYGPNGIGKSNFLEAIRLLSFPWRLKGRKDCILFFRRLTYHTNYLPNYEGFSKDRTNLYMRATFSTDAGDKDLRPGLLGPAAVVH